MVARRRDPRIEDIQDTQRLIIRMLQALLRGERQIMASVADIDAQVDALDNDLTTLAGAVQTVDDDLSARTAELVALIQSGTTDPAALQAVSDKLVSTAGTVSDLNAAIQAAVDANPDPTP